MSHFVGGVLNTGTCVMVLLTLRKTAILTLTSCYVGSGVVMSGRDPHINHCHANCKNHTSFLED